MRVEKKNSNRKIAIKTCSTISCMVTATDWWRILYPNTPIPSSPFRTLGILPNSFWATKEESFSADTNNCIPVENYTHSVKNIHIRKDFYLPITFWNWICCVPYITLLSPFALVEEILCQTHTYRSSLQKPHHVKVTCLLRLDYRKACVPLQTILSLSQSTQHMQRLFQE